MHIHCDIPDSRRLRQPYCNVGDRIILQLSFLRADDYNSGPAAGVREAAARSVLSFSLFLAVGDTNLPR